MECLCKLGLQLGGAGNFFRTARDEPGLIVNLVILGFRGRTTPNIVQEIPNRPARPKLAFLIQ
jgi:hypothetical protein